MRLSRQLARSSVAHPHGSRGGMTLLEVVISLAIFLFALTAISQLISMSTQANVDSNLRSRAGLICQTKMAELLAGVLPMSGTSYADEVGNDDFEWMMTCDQDQNASLPVAGLYSAEVFVRKKGRPSSEVSLRQMVFDPSLKGSTLDAPPSLTAPSASSSSSGTPSSSSGTPSTPSGGGM